MSIETRGKLVSCYGDGKKNDECDGGIWPTDAVQLCRAGSLRINQLGGMKTLLLILFTTSLLFLQMLQMC